MYCQNCGTEVTGKFCPNCGTAITSQVQQAQQVQPQAADTQPSIQNPNPKKNGGVIAIIIIVCVFGFAALMGILFGEAEPADSSSGIAQMYTSSQKENKGSVNYANFEKIENGMTYAQVVEILGKEGKVMSSVDLGTGDEYVTTIYSWNDWTGVANCNVTFQGGKVIAKAQAGLR